MRHKGKNLTVATCTCFRMENWCTHTHTHTRNPRVSDLLILSGAPASPPPPPTKTLTPPPPWLPGSRTSWSSWETSLQCLAHVWVSLSSAPRRATAPSLIINLQSCDISSTQTTRTDENDEPGHIWFWAVFQHSQRHFQTFQREVKHWCFYCFLTS